MFETENSIEPVRSQSLVAATRNVTRPSDSPIREATPAEVAGNTLRRARAQTADEPVQAVKRGMFQRTPKQPAQPDAVSKTHGLYVTEKRSTRVYYADYQQKSEVMRADAAKISTKMADRQTVTAMLDLAQSRGWDTVKLRGTDDFKREAWVQAQVRGLTTEGYKPQQTDVQESARRKEAAGPVEALPKLSIPIQAVISKKSDVLPVKVSAYQKAGIPAKQTSHTAEPKQAAAAVWGSVEAAGQQARAKDSPKQAAKQATVETPKITATAA